MHRGITHPGIGVSYTESRGFTHRLCTQLGGKPAFFARFYNLNLLNESLLTESLTVNRHTGLTMTQI